MKQPSPDQVLQNYFDALLDTDEAASPTRYADPLEEQRERLQKLLYSAAISAQELERAESVIEPVHTLVSDPEPTPLPEAIQEPLASTQVPSTLAPDIEEAIVEPVSAEAFSYQAKDLEWLPNGRPAWAQSRFDVLLFDVSGLTLAVPLISLGQIQPITDALTPLFGQVDWFMGIQPTPAGKIRTVNTAKFVMPERYDEAFLDSAKYVISIDGVPWGLAVDSVRQPVTLEPSDVKWRGERSKRPWLAGMVKERMCALLDVPRIGQILMEAERRQRA
ncbi:chemotaxis protein CheW [Marinimicrobium sp. ABcell2]|uniref:chemotaxis protein CheW n=1 Tax=Marinimicrobium sp. ABcell2 TaxID=3069751 RepID=UPI0027B28BCE|nr:chemotaxis protein CheW [Marinimicrobium sp. ABcell2]MDQ2078069.1 chemotaxis protein CheW [Marinimicrobium sp. ABcell2]